MIHCIEARSACWEVQIQNFKTRREAGEFSSTKVDASSLLPHASSHSSAVSPHKMGEKALSHIRYLMEIIPFERYILTAIALKLFRFLTIFFNSMSLGFLCDDSGRLLYGTFLEIH